MCELWAPWHDVVVVLAVAGLWTLAVWAVERRGR